MSTDINDILSREIDSILGCLGLQHLTPGTSNDGHFVSMYIDSVRSVGVAIFITNQELEELNTDELLTRARDRATKALVDYKSKEN